MMKPFFVHSISLIFCFCGMLLQGQNNTGTDIPFEILKVGKEPLAPENVISNPQWFSDKKQFSKTHPKDVYWLKADFSEVLADFPEDEIRYLSFGNLNKAEVYFRENENLYSCKAGSFQLNREFTGIFPVKKENLIDTTFLFLKFSKLNTRYNLGSHRLTLYNEDVHVFRENHISIRQSKIVKQTFLFLGVSILVILMALTIFLVNRKKEYLYYALFVLCMALFFGRNYLSFYEETIGNYSFTNFFLSNFLEISSSIFYILFVKFYLNTSNFYPLLNKIFNFGISFLTVFLIINSVLLFQGNFSVHITLLDVRAIVISAFVLFSIVYLFFHLKNKLVYFIIAGSLFYSIGSILVYTTGQGHFLRTGALLEIIIFGLGLGYKIKLEQAEKFRLQEESINHYITALRAQMNPHFIFNSLSSIQHLVLKSDTPGALKYLSKFSQLMRSTLESSIEKNVTLAEEIKLLETYLDLESLRFDDSFTYEIKVEKHLNTQLLEVPLLIIQPFVENAILHGLLHKKEGEKKLIVSFSEDETHIIATIEDNGIGRKASKKLYEENARPGKISRGMELTEKRIEIFKTHSDKAGYFAIEDLADASGNPAGTKVIIKIPKN